MFTIPNNTKHKEKNTFIFRTAMISSVALGLIYVYQFQILGTKKCHNPKQIVTALPAVIRILPSKYIVYPPKNII
jgi:hypothetical protein